MVCVKHMRWLKVLEGLLIVFDSGKDLLNNTIHVRLFRQHVPGNNWDRFPVKSLFESPNFGRTN